jgi:hypothetical protein
VLLPEQINTRETTMPNSKAALAACAVAIAIAGASADGSAATIAALQDGKSIVLIDTDKKKVMSSVKLAGGGKLVGIDVRPADGKLYGLTPDGAIVTVDAKNGKWEKKSQISEKLPAGAVISVDFNPAADRLRVLTSTGTSLRINVDDGKTIVDGSLKYADADANKGKTPRVTAGAYSNSFAGTKETNLYDLDTLNWVYARQAPPNDGILNSLGKVVVRAPIAFDILSDGKGGNQGWLLSNGTLYTLDIATGVTTATGKVMGLKGKISDIAILPAM